MALGLAFGGFLTAGSESTRWGAGAVFVLAGAMLLLAAVPERTVLELALGGFGSDGAPVELVSRSCA